jgi:glutamine synthetase
MLSRTVVEPFSASSSRSAAAAQPRCASVKELRHYLKEADCPYVKIAFTDLDGVLRGKYLAKRKFLTALEEGIAFCDVVLGWDCNDQLYDNARATGWHTGYPDGRLRIVADSLRILPFENNMPFVLCEFAGGVADLCPRRLLGRTLERLDALGFRAFAGVEYEFFLFDETPESVRAKAYRNLQTLTPGYFGYSVLRSSVHAELYAEILDYCEQMAMPLEGLHTETGPGVIEAAMAYDAALRSADNAALFKTFTKVFAQRRNLMACFMAKWSERWPGQSGHLHISLRSHDGKHVFHDDAAPHSISTCMRHFIGGMQKLLPELTCMAAPTINAYSRLIPGYWAPTRASWGIENRTVALRAIIGQRSAQRVEYRLAGADANPYLALSAALASGAWGIENKIEPTAPTAGNDYQAGGEPIETVPSTLFDAARRFAKSTAAKELFGETFVEHYAATREWEAREFQKYVTDWELQRYFEII